MEIVKWDQITPKQRKLIIKLIKLGARNVDVASVRWNCNEILKNDVHFRIVQRMAMRVTLDSRYLKVKSITQENDFDVTLNPNYRFWNSKPGLTMLIGSILIAFFTWLFTQIDIPIKSMFHKKQQLKEIQKISTPKKSDSVYAKHDSTNNLLNHRKKR